MDFSPTFTHHGGADGVTGSCHRLTWQPDSSLLIDCGLFQGEDAGTDELAQHQVSFPLEDVLALVVTHVHIDHIGRLPYLMAAGFNGPIICSEPSARLLPLVIEDALKIGFTRDRRLIEQFQDRVHDLLVPVPYKQWYTLVDDADWRVRIKLKRAGHILGSAYVEVDLLRKADKATHRAVFSGDLGAPYAPLLPAPVAPYQADTLVIESTYGDRDHESRRDRRLRLKAAIESALANGGTVVIPAFSIGRTQELLYELEGLIHSGGSRWQDLEVVVDSPLASRFTQVYRDLKPFWDAEAQRRVRAGRHPLSFENLYTVDSHEEHERAVEYLARTQRPAVVIAASGMAAGGRVVNYLKAMLEDEHHHVLFVGYQAQGTPGRAIQTYGPRGGWVELDGQRYTIRAGVTTIGGYSAHAGRQDLLNFIRRMRHWPKQVRVVHGDRRARAGFKAAVEAMAAEQGKSVEVVLPGNG
ncbi:MBL fold metallo-hydrolase RNA specificity domain-containing protein [Marinimicrobium alkaliphilum]|uniref:MBL fold metallo-hydrolase RNA specificity domain-containing protein n=1 Tax=Marinimicrobium alkaliphilum TaxID=2202654 RepID=UPI000DBA2949|nr:MBL fold metallo-hydrolase [Marinimicrobium alkaliphilum]